MGREGRGCARVEKRRARGAATVPYGRARSSSEKHWREVNPSATCGGETALDGATFWRSNGGGGAPQGSARLRVRFDWDVARWTAVLLSTLRIMSSSWVDAGITSN